MSTEDNGSGFEDWSRPRSPLSLPRRVGSGAWRWGTILVWGILLLVGGGLVALCWGVSRALIDAYRVVFG